jgi:FlaG/FlaF family flagellin (archaellin)
MSPPIRRRLRGDGAAVSDVLGSILMVGITVVMATSLGFLILNFQGPQKVTRANLAIRLDPGLQGWGTGDESIKISHLGGDDLPASSTRVTYRLNAVTTTLTGNALGSLFSDGKLSIGETWVRPQALLVSDSVSVSVVSGLGASNLVAATTLVPAVLGSGPNCVLDTSAPTADLWTETVGGVGVDVKTTTTTAVDITGHFVDACRGVSPSLPELWYRIYDTVAGTPTTYTKVTTAITSPATATFKGTIPALDYAHNGGTNKHLQFQFRLVSDGTTSGTVDGPDDIIEVVTTFTPLNCPFVVGTVLNCVNAQENNPGTLATAQEVATNNNVALATYQATAAAATGTGIGQGQSCVVGGASSGAQACATSSVNGFARLDASTDGVSGSSFTSLTPPSNAVIDQVVLGFTARKSASGDTTPTVRLTYTGFTDPSPLISPSSGTVGSCTALSSSSVTATCETDVTADRSWAAADFATLAVVVDGTSPASVGTSPSNHRADVDTLYVKVAYHYNTYSLTAQAGFSSVPSGPSGTRQVDLMASTNGDSFKAQVCNDILVTCATWVDMGTITSVTPTTQQIVYTLTTTAEYNSGSPRVRFIDSTPAGTVQSTLSLDYLRMNTS